METTLIAVVPTGEARQQLSATTARFRRDGISAEPVVFGSHRRPEAVVLPFSLYERILPAIEDALLAELVRARLADDRPSVPIDDVINGLGFLRSDFQR